MDEWHYDTKAQAAKGRHLRKNLDERKNNQIQSVIDGLTYKTVLKPQLRKYLREYADVHFMSESEAVRHAIRQLIVSWKEGKAV